MANKLEPIGKSSTGLDENIAALIVVIFAPLSSLIFFLIEKDSKFVKFYAIQSGVSQLILLVLGSLLSCVLIGFIFYLLYLVVLIVLAIKAYQGEWYEMPIFGKMAMNNINKE